MNLFYITAVSILSMFILVQISVVESRVEDFGCFTQPCCESAVNVNETSIRFRYVVTNSSTANLTDKWRLDVMVSWNPVETNELVSYEIEWEETVSFSDLKNTGPITPNDGTCSQTFRQPCHSVRRSNDLTDYSSIAFKDIPFGFRFLFRIRVLKQDDEEPLGVSVCIDGGSYPLLSPDCYRETEDAEFCRTQDILVAGEVLNFKIADVGEHLDEEGVRRVWVRLTWQRPVQVNGQVVHYAVNRFEPNAEVAVSKPIVVEEGTNSTEDTVFEATFNNLRNDTFSEFVIRAFVRLDVGSFDSLETPEGNPRSITHHALLRSTINTAFPEVTSEPSMNMTSQPGGGNIDLTVVIIVIVIAVLLLVAIVLILGYRRRRRKKQEDEENFVFQPTFRRKVVDMEKSRRDYVAPEFKDVEIFDYHHIKEGELLGSGQYGEVFKGEARLQGKDQWTVVAIKKPKNAMSPDVLDDFKNEIRLMLELGKHPNIVSVLGCCTVDEPFYLITDFMEYGDLLHFLRKCTDEENWKSDYIYKITTFHQLQIARQIADGMNYVSHTRFFHGDLAARNILVGRGLTIKITDFGLTDDLYQKEYTRLQATAKRPYKWYSPESIEHQYCTLKTDIWSFGVLMWEIVTFGNETPYHGMSINEVLHRLKTGYRMSCPEGTPEFMEKLIQSCWQLEPDDRPDFENLLETINFLLERGTSEDANYIAAGEEIEEDKPISPNKRKKSLIYLLQFDTIDPSVVSGSADSAFVSGGGSGMSLMSSSLFSDGSISSPILEGEDEDEEGMKNDSERESDDDNGYDGNSDGADSNDGNDDDGVSKDDGADNIGYTVDEEEAVDTYGVVITQEEDAKGKSLEVDVDVENLPAVS